MKLNASQVLVLAHYCGGEFLWIETDKELDHCGDGLFRFLMDEAGDAGSPEEFHEMLDTAIGLLRSLKADLS